jgi:hypothetical protein
MFARFFNILSRKDRRSHRSTSNPQRRPTRRPLECEALEDRFLLSVLGEFQVNTTTRNNQSEAANACAANGRSVAVWTDQYSDSDADVRAQVYNSSGLPSGPEILVAYTTRNEHHPKVAMDAAGNFVVTWVYDYSSTDQDLYAQRFRWDGVRLGGNLAIATSGHNEYEPSIAMDATGDFVVSYTYDVTPTDQDVHARRFTADGTFLGELNVGTSSLNEHASSVAMASNGRFVIAYQQDESNGYDAEIRVAHYTRSGDLIDDQADDYPYHRRDTNPSVSIDDYGNAVVVYQAWVGGDYDIKARRSNSAGATGGELTIAATYAQEEDPVVALDRTTGQFVVAYYVLPADGSSGHIEVREVSASDAVGAATDLGSNLGGPAISIDGNGYYMLTYFTYGHPGNQGLDIAGRFGYLNAG